MHGMPCSVGFLVVFIGLALMRRCIGCNGRHATTYCSLEAAEQGYVEGAHACNAWA